MNQEERRIWLISELLKEDEQYRNIAIPEGEEEQKHLLRGLMNVRAPKEISAQFQTVQDAYLQEAARDKGITRVQDLKPVKGNLYLWRGDITAIDADAIVNAANSGMTGCYAPNHGCIDNAIHTYAGIELRNACAQIMEAQGHEEPTGQAKITPAFNLPSKYVLHTVGPVVMGHVTRQNRKDLESSYLSCLKLADEYHCQSIAFCCISTGVFGYPREAAAETAVETVETYLKESGSQIKVIFNVFKEEDERIYRRILGSYRSLYWQT
jgi:O-acetyl-ADP-ribose deacetylase (regulator of RNase III)